MRTQPGFISSQLHQGIAGSGVFFNYAVWESTAALRKALSNTDLEAIMERYGAGTVISPHIFKKLAVLGICVD
jgi:quinol monooxygenase YgiN